MALDLYERLVANDQTLVKFDFNIYRFNGEQIEKSFQSLEKNTSSEKISVLGLNLCPDDIASDIAEALQKHPKLAKVRLDEIPSQTFALFACAISNNDRLSHLQISGGGTVKGHEMRRLHGVGSLWSPCEESKPQRTLLSPSCRHSRDDQGDSSFPSNQSSAGNHLFRSVSFDDLDATELPSAVMTIVQAAHGHQSLRKFAFDMRDVFIIEEDDDIKSDFVSKIAGMIHGTPSLRSLCSCLMAALLDQTHFSLSWKVCEVRTLALKNSISGQIVLERDLGLFLWSFFNATASSSVFPWYQTEWETTCKSSRFCSGIE